MKLRFSAASSDWAMGEHRRAAVGKEVLREHEVRGRECRRGAEQGSGTTLDSKPEPSQAVRTHDGRMTSGNPSSAPTPAEARTPAAR